MKSDMRPLVLLDVDGVINDLGSCMGRARPWGVDVIQSHGYWVCIPDYMPDLIQRIGEMAEVHWCTTWRARANDEIAAHLGVGPLPVVDDGTGVRATYWKATAAFDLAARALVDGRRVIWIEDFYGRPPVDEMPIGVEFVDTGRSHFDAVLLPEQVAHLLALSAA